MHVERQKASDARKAAKKTDEEVKWRREQKRKRLAEAALAVPDVAPASATGNDESLDDAPAYAAEVQLGSTTLTPAEGKGEL